MFRIEGHAIASSFLVTDSLAATGSHVIVE